MDSLTFNMHLGVSIMHVGPTFIIGCVWTGSRVWAHIIPRKHHNSSSGQGFAKPSPQVQHECLYESPNLLGVVHTISNSCIDACLPCSGGHGGVGLCLGHVCLGSPHGKQPPQSASQPRKPKEMAATTQHHGNCNLVVLRVHQHDT